jgi:NADH-quinone oxidoreductase subunit N
MESLNPNDFGLMNPNWSIMAILPETIIAVAAVLVLIWESLFPRQGKVTGTISLIGLILAAAFLLNTWNDAPGYSWNGMIATDGLRTTFSIVFLFVSAMTILISTVWVDRENVPVGDYHAMLMFATFGMMFMASGNDFVVIFLGLETLSIATYVLAGLRKGDLKSNESAMKYFILGSFASAFLLYGMALVYGATGTTVVSEIALKIPDATFPPLLLIGGAMMLIGFGFKIASVPFHVWTPDVYEGAPTPVTGFMAAGPKAAAFASFVRVFVLGFPVITGAQAAGYLNTSWVTAVAVMAMLTMTVGNLAAVVQNNVKRMLAYSSISHAGYAMVGLLGAGVAISDLARDEAIAGVAFYMLTYGITTMGAFAVITLLSGRNDATTGFDDYNGIGFKSPVLAFTLSLFMLSLLGLPLTAGFMGKIMVFRPALVADNPLLTTVVVVAVVNTAISAYYYLRMLVVMFFRERTSEWTAPKIPLAITAVLVITVLGVLYLGIFSNATIKKFIQPNTVNAEMK